MSSEVPKQGWSGWVPCIKACAGPINTVRLGDLLLDDPGFPRRLRIQGFMQMIQHGPCRPCPLDQGRVKIR